MSGSHSSTFDLVDVATESAGTTSNVSGSASSLASVAFEPALLNCDQPITATNSRESLAATTASGRGRVEDGRSWVFATFSNLRVHAGRIATAQPANSATHTANGQ